MPVLLGHFEDILAGLLWDGVRILGPSFKTKRILQAISKEL